jgi:hypothetical protein
MEDDDTTRMPDHWEMWQVDTALQRAQGVSLRKISAATGRGINQVQTFCISPEAADIIRTIRREAAAVMYGQAVALTDKAMAGLVRLLDSEDLNQVAKGIDLVRKMTTDSLTADGAQALRELKALIKGGA